MALLEERGVEYRYRDYRAAPLTGEEISAVLEGLGVGPRNVLRTRDRAFAEAGLTGDEADATLIAHMVERPTLLQRPIGVLGDRAVVGRPPERLLELLGDEL